jgi:hypothetical protein
MKMRRWEVDRAVNDGIELTGASAKWCLANARCSVAEGLSSRAAGPRNGETLAPASAHLGRDAEAREAAARLLEVDPAFTISAWIARGGTANMKLSIGGLRKAVCVPKTPSELLT